MDKISLNYSLKDIPIQSNRAYLIKMFDMTNKFLNRLRWAVYWHEKKDNIDPTDSETDYGANNNLFPSRKSAPISPKLTGFENDLFNLCKNLKFKKPISKFQKDLKHPLTN